MIKINRHTLQNGLRLVHAEDCSTGMVAINVLYGVGSRDEDENRTGFAHLMEHLMFGGSKNVPDYDIPIQMAGGENNAWTNCDVTNYYLTLPYNNIETGFWIESDRMLELLFDDKSLEVQRNVVVEEFKQRCLNQPYGDAGHLVRSMAYKNHPYRWPTIGIEPRHIEEATMEDVKDFYYRFYAPDNAVIAVTGNISFEESVRLTEKWFGNISRHKAGEKNVPKEEKQTEERRMTVRRNVPVDMIYMVFKMCERTNPDYPIYDLISDLLSNGRSSRLVLRLCQEKKIFSTIDAYITGSIDDGLLQICGKIADGITPEEAERAIWEELNRLKTETADVMEMEKVKNRFESERIFENISYMNVASNIAFHEMIGKAEDINFETEKYRAVSTDDVMRIARKCFVKENCCVLYYLKETEKCV